MRHLFGILIFAFVSNAFSLQPDDFCGMQATAGSSSQLGGRYKPASGTFKVLVIYAQFSDDNTDINNTNWVKGQSPSDLPPYDVPVLSLDFLPQALASRS